MKKSKLNVVCLGGGVGTVNLITGLKEFTDNITVIVSMADDGGSAGRLRRFYRVPPPGDIINCIAAMSDANSLFRSMLTYRFAGNRYGSDRSLPGHKLGNLMLVALISITGSFSKALSEMQIICKTRGKILPASEDSISIWARTSVGENVYREENIDLGRFTGKIETLYITPSKPKVSNEVLSAISDADILIAGPGDLYTTVLPVLLIPAIRKTIKISRARRFYIVNVANKSFETPDFEVKDYANAILKHCGAILFDTFVVNNNYNPPIPRKFTKLYSYVKLNKAIEKYPFSIISADLVNDSFPVYHDSKKLAKTLFRAL